MLTIEQITALNTAKAGHSLLICGQAGTGKTYLLKFITKDLKRSRNVSLLCTTGIACMQYSELGATTVHSFAGLQDGRFDDLTLENLVRYDDKYHKVRNSLTSCNTVIIDEISMLSKKDFEQLELVSRICRNNNKVFGGLQLILCGDFYQLPPVPNPLHNDNGQYCFESAIFKQIVPHKIILTQVMRQSEEIFIKAVRETALGSVSNEVDTFLRTLDRPLEVLEQKHLFARNYDVAVFNSQCLEKLETNGKLYRATKNSGDQKYLRRILAPHYLHLKEGCPVVLLCNLGGKLVNGLSGIVKKIEDDYIYVYFEDIKESHRIVRHKFTQYSTYKKSVVAEREQFPLLLAYGLTVHKSQGMTIKSCVVHCNGIFEAGQLSVAIGRAVSSEGLQLIGYRKGLCLQPKPTVSSFYKDPTSPLLPDLSCCQEFFQMPRIDDDSDNIGVVDVDSSDDEELLREINIIESLQELPPCNEELPEYININELKMKCFMETPVTATHLKMNDICNCVDFDRLKYFCQIQFKRIKGITSDLTLETKCTPKQWTSVLGTNHKYYESEHYLSSARTLFRVTELSNEHKCFTSTITLEILKAEIHNRCQGGATAASLQSFTADMSDAGKAKVRYVAGMCVAKLKNHYMNTVITNQNNPDKAVQKNVKIAKDKVEVLKQMVADENLNYEDKTLQEIERRQNARRGLTYVNDLTFQFFLHLLSRIGQKLNKENFRQQGAEIFENAYSYLKSDEDLQMLFSEIITTSENEINMSVFEEIIHKFLMVSHKQFLKDTKDRLDVTKKKAHREEITKKAEKRKSEIQLSMKDIVTDKTEKRSTSHMKLKLNCLANESYLCGKDFTKAKLMELCEAHGVNCTASMKKQEISKGLHVKIISSEEMLNPDALSSEASTSSSQVAGTKRQKKPGKGKGKGKGKKKAETKYICRVCKEEYLDGEEWIQCDDCNAWLHRTCENVSDEQWEALQQDDDDIPWSCSQCSQD